MVRTQVQLTALLARDLKTVARNKGVSVSEMIRRCVAEHLAGESHDRSLRWERARRWGGGLRNRNGAEDVAVNHDKYLDEAYR